MPTKLTEPVLPLPNEQFDSEIVVASIWQNDDAEFGPIFALLLTLAKEPPFFTVREITWENHIYHQDDPDTCTEFCHETPQWVTNHRESHPNIVPAVRAYENRGGDY